MVEEPTQDLKVLTETTREEEQEDSENEEDRDIPDDHENEKEQLTVVLFTLEQLEVLFKMNRFDFTELVATLKKGASKGVGFKLAELGNFDTIWNQKVVDAWLAGMEDYIHAAKIGRHSAVEPAQCYLKGYVKVYFELMLEIWHMHELNHVCHFVMGLPTLAKRKLEEYWHASLSEAIMKMEGFSDVGWGEKSIFKNDNKFHHKKAHHEREWSRG